MITLAVAIFGAVAGPFISVALFWRLGRRKEADEERAQDLALARLEVAVEAIPERMNGKILKALDHHQTLCPWGHREKTDPAIPS
jgi:hypothetical protein